MSEKNYTYKIVLIGALIIAAVSSILIFHQFSLTESANDTVASKPLKLYWFIPDGLRAEPVTFKIFEWAREGKLPNIKTLMEQGSYGYSLPVFPGHTPTNFATLLTGSTPNVHGVADGPMRLQRYPLSIISKSGFSSHAKQVPPIWYTLEKNGSRVALLSVPGSTPPELSKGITIKGRWGGWGIEFAATNFHNASDTTLRTRQGIENRLFEQGQPLTKYINSSKADGWVSPPESFSEPRQLQLENWGETLFAYIYDSQNDNIEQYDRILLSRDRKTTLVDLRVGEWSDWFSLNLQWQTSNDYNLFTPKKSNWELALGEINIPTMSKIKVIRLGEKDAFRIRFLYDGLNRFLSKPPEIADSLRQFAGPMVDFPDNFPPQLIHVAEDKDTFFEEALFSLEWHRKAARYLIKNSDADIIIHDIYTPNQILTSRWWMGFVDPDSPDYDTITSEERDKLWSEILKVYQGIDDIIGEVLGNKDENTAIVLSSDHGVVPLHTRVHLNNLFAKEGWLSYQLDPQTGYAKIDWEKSQVVFLKMDNIYINPNGLGGNYTRSSGKQYEELRSRVISRLQRLRTEHNKQPLAKVLRWEDAGLMDLPSDRVGDLIVANSVGFGWSETISKDQKIFSTSPTSGYKQAVIPKSSKGMWTPLIISGPGVKQNYSLKTLANHIDQYPTIMNILNQPIPEHVTGKMIDEIFNK